MYIITGITIALVVTVPLIFLVTWLLKRAQPVSPVTLPAEFGRELPELSPELFSDIKNALWHQVEISGREAWSKVMWDSRTVGMLTNHIDNLMANQRHTLVATSLNSEQYVMHCRMADYLYRCGVPASQSLRVTGTIIELLNAALMHGPAYAVDKFSELSTPVRK